MIASPRCLTVSYTHLDVYKRQVKSGAYDRAMTVLAQALERESGGTMSHAPGFGRLISKGCPRFVSLVEKGVTKGPDAAKVIDEDLRELKAAGIGSLILGLSLIHI